MDIYHGAVIINFSYMKLTQDLNKCDYCFGPTLYYETIMEVEAYEFIIPVILKEVLMGFNFIFQESFAIVK